MRRLAAAALAFCLAAPAVVIAEDRVIPDFEDPISLRRTAMKQVGAGMGALGAMAKQEAPFDAPLAAMSMRAMLAATTGYARLFPEGTESGGGSTAAPALWSDRAGFETKMAEFIGDLDGLLQAPPTEPAALGPVMQTLGANCKGCHETYRIKKN